MLKTSFPYIVLFVFFPFIFFAQNFEEAEIDALAEKIAVTIDAKNDRLKKKERFNAILVEDFKDADGNLSRIGANLAQEFSLSLSNAGLTFQVTSVHDLQNQSKPRNRISLQQVVQGAGVVADAVTDETDQKQLKKRDDTMRSINDAAAIGSSINSNKNNNVNYKGIDAVVTGIVTESSDQYKLLIKVVSTDKGSPTVAGARGSITKSQSIQQPEEDSMEATEGQNK